MQWDEAYINQTLGGTVWLPPSTCRVMVLSQKNIKVGSDVSSRADVAHLLKDNVGSGTARQYTGSIVDNIAPINKDLFNVHMDKKCKLSWVARTDGGTGNLQGFSAGTQTTQYFTCRIKMPSQTTFDNGNGSWPNNFAPFICMGAVQDDNSGAFTVATPFRLTWLSTAYFTDA